MFGGMMMAGVTPAWVGGVGNGATIRPVDIGAVAGDLLYLLQASPSITAASAANLTYAFGTSPADEIWSMLALRGGATLLSRGSAFAKHARHAGLLITTEIAPSYGVDVGVQVVGTEVGRSLGFYSPPSANNLNRGLHLWLYPQRQLYPDMGAITFTAPAGADYGATVYEILGA